MENIRRFFSSALLAAALLAGCSAPGAELPALPREVEAPFTAEVAGSVLEDVDTADLALAMAEAADTEAHKLVLELAQTMELAEEDIGCSTSVAGRYYLPGEGPDRVIGCLYLYRLEVEIPGAQEDLGSSVSIYYVPVEVADVAISEGAAVPGSTPTASLQKQIPTGLSGEEAGYLPFPDTE